MIRSFPTFTERASPGAPERVWVVRSSSGEGRGRDNSRAFRNGGDAWLAIRITSGQTPPLFEACADSVESAVAAEKGGPRASSFAALS
jgi:hypothetical protein